LSRKGAKDRTQGRKPRSIGTKASMRAAGSREPQARPPDFEAYVHELEKKLEERERAHDLRREGCMAIHLRWREFIVRLGSAASWPLVAHAPIPIVFVSGGDPVKLGLVASLNRPGGNVTGVTFVVAELGAKQLGLLHELQPGAVRVGVLVDPNYPVIRVLYLGRSGCGLVLRGKSKSSKPPPAVTLMRPLRDPKSRLMRLATMPDATGSPARWTRCGGRYHG
jgi:hypothetical protein